MVELLTVVAVVSFLNEEKYLPEFLKSMHRQTRPPDRLVLVDDGSTDASYAIAGDFAERHPYATVLRRPPRKREADRLATAAELLSFEWGLEQVEERHDIIVKLDADLRLAPEHFEYIVEQFERDPRLGMAGAYLSRPLPDGGFERERTPHTHVRGPNKFYRRACYQDISPLPAHLGWDHIDEVKAGMHGWVARAFTLPTGDSIHLRPTGTQDGALRGYRRWGECTWSYGAHPVIVLCGTARRLVHRPYLLAGMSFLYGWIRAAVLRRPRVERPVRAAVTRQYLDRLRVALRDGESLLGPLR